MNIDPAIRDTLDQARTALNSIAATLPAGVTPIMTQFNTDFDLLLATPKGLSHTNANKLITDLRTKIDGLAALTPADKTAIKAKIDSLEEANNEYFNHLAYEARKVQILNANKKIDELFKDSFSKTIPEDEHTIGGVVDNNSPHDGDSLIDRLMREGGSISANKFGGRTFYTNVTSMIVPRVYIAYDTGTNTFTSNHPAAFAEAMLAAGNTSVELTWGAPKNIVATMAQCLRVGIHEVTVPAHLEEKIRQDHELSIEYDRLKRLSTAMTNEFNGTLLNDLSNPIKIRESHGRVLETLDNTNDQESFLNVVYGHQEYFHPDNMPSWVDDTMADYNHINAANAQQKAIYATENFSMEQLAAISKSAPPEEKAEIIANLIERHANLPHPSDAKIAQEFYRLQIHPLLMAANDKTTVFQKLHELVASRPTLQNSYTVTALEAMKSTLNQHSILNRKALSTLSETIGLLASALAQILLRSLLTQDLNRILNERHGICIYSWTERKNSSGC